MDVDLKLVSTKQLGQKHGCTGNQSIEPNTARVLKLSVNQSSMYRYLVTSASIGYNDISRRRQCISGVKADYAIIKNFLIGRLYSPLNLKANKIPVNVYLQIERSTSL